MTITGSHPHLVTRDGLRRLLDLDLTVKPGQDGDVASALCNAWMDAVEQRVTGAITSQSPHRAILEQLLPFFWTLIGEVGFSAANEFIDLLEASQDDDQTCLFYLPIFNTLMYGLGQAARDPGSLAVISIRKDAAPTDSDLAKEPLQRIFDHPLASTFLCVDMSHPAETSFVIAVVNASAWNAKTSQLGAPEHRIGADEPLGGLAETAIAPYSITLAGARIGAEGQPRSVFTRICQAADRQLTPADLLAAYDQLEADAQANLVGIIGERRDVRTCSSLLARMTRAQSIAA